MALLQEEMRVQMTAAEIAECLRAPLRNCPDGSLAVCGFSTDTRTIEAGNCFIALKGGNFDGNAYAKQAAEKGASFCVLTAEPAEELPVPYAVAPDEQHAYADLANLYLRKCKKNGLHVIGITGSSGKPCFFPDKKIISQQLSKESK